MNTDFKKSIAAHFRVLGGKFVGKDPYASKRLYRPRRDWYSVLVISTIAIVAACYWNIGVYRDLQNDERTLSVVLPTAPKESIDQEQLSQTLLDVAAKSAAFDTLRRSLPSSIDPSR